MCLQDEKNLSRVFLISLTNKIMLLLLIAFLASCNNSGLNKDFIVERYEIDSKIIQKKKDVSNLDKFLLNYGILRHRDYYNYEIEGKTFEEIRIFDAIL